jgi:hypothetical protein
MYQLVTLAVAVVVVLGFRVLGSPANQRLVQADLRTVIMLSRLAQEINRRWVAGGKTLPANTRRLSKSVLALRMNSGIGGINCGTASVVCREGRTGD